MHACVRVLKFIKGKRSWCPGGQVICAEEYFAVNKTVDVNECGD